jgi:hypothetical protein
LGMRSCLILIASMLPNPWRRSISCPRWYISSAGVSTDGTAGMDVVVVAPVAALAHLKKEKCHSHIYISNLCNSKYAKCTRRPAGTSTDLSKERQHRYIPTYFHNVRIYSCKTKMQN